MDTKSGNYYHCDIHVIICKSPHWDGGAYLSGSVCDLGYASCMLVTHVIEKSTE